MSAFGNAVGIFSFGNKMAELAERVSEGRHLKSIAEIGHMEGHTYRGLCEYSRISVTQYPQSTPYSRCPQKVHRVFFHMSNFCNAFGMSSFGNSFTGLAE
jgi:hypothetical protein